MADKSPHAPVVYNSNQQSSPVKASTWKAADPAKLGTPLERNAEIDRQLQVWDSMDRSLLTTPDEFEKKVLWPEVNGDIPKPSRKAVDTMTKVVNELFYTAEGKRRQNVSEDNIADAMVNDGINKIALPGKLRAALSQDNYAATDSTKSKVDAALYSKNVVPQDGRPDWTHLRLFIEFKKGGAANDPFDDKNEQSPESWAQSRAAVRGQLLAYASNTFQYQHRTALYSLLINGDEFRAMYWDRSGLIVTEATNYVEDQGSLLRFLWLFASLTEEQQGIDPTATLLSEGSDDYELMDTLALDIPGLDLPFHDLADVSDMFSNQDTTTSLGPAAGTRGKTKKPTQPVFKYVREGFRNSLGGVSGWPRYKIIIDKHEFLVAKPVFMSTSMFGRGTRGYIAWDVKGHRFVWLKDTWRPQLLKTMAWKPGIKLTIPTVIAHGDVLKQTTFSAEYMKAQQSQSEMHSVENNASSESARGKKRAREGDETLKESEEEASRMFIHYRIAVEEVCLKMGQFTSGEQLVRLILDCIITHRDAYVHFDLLHRDISTGNILILPRVEQGRTGKKRVVWDGFLTDWELAKYVPKHTILHRARQPERTGTWQFMSVAYVAHPERPVNIPDDLESFFHVLLHHAVRYLRHSFQGGVTSFITNYFDTFQNLKDKSSDQACSAIKEFTVSEGVIRLNQKDLQFWNEHDMPQHPLNDLLRSWLTLYVARYRILREQDRELSAIKTVAKDSANGASSHVQERTDNPASQTPDDEFPDIRKKHLDIHSNNEDPIATTLPADVTAVEVISDLTRVRAAQLETHAKTISIFNAHVSRSSWPKNDVVGDQLDASYNPKKQIVALKSAVTSHLTSGRISTSSKKARTLHSADVASGSKPRR